MSRKPRVMQVVREVVVLADPEGNRQERRMAKRLGVCASSQRPDASAAEESSSLSSTAETPSTEEPT